MDSFPQDTMAQLEMFLTPLVARATGYCSDSRQFKAGDIFVALKGEKSDGHAFAERIATQQPTAVIVEKGYTRAHAAAPGVFIEVTNTHAAHRFLAGAFRKKFGGKVIAVGGSSGKTTTKEFLATLLASQFNIVKTQKSQNGELGIPKTLEQLRTGVDLAVIEVGIDAPGDMARHVSIVDPEIGVLTSIGEEHLNLLGSVENVFREECILFESVWRRGGHCFAPANDPWLAGLRGHRDLTFTPPSDPQLKAQLRNPHALQNLCLAVAVARHVGVSAKNIQRTLPQLHIPDGRGVEHALRPDLFVLADHYNSNLSSLRAGLAYAVELAKSQKLALRLVIGDMLDLGSQSEILHHEAATLVAGTHAAEVILVGPEFARHVKLINAQCPRVRCFTDSQSAAAVAPELSRAGGLIFIKGSRGMALEHVLQPLLTLGARA